MQEYGLTVDRFLDHAAKWHGQASNTYSQIGSHPFPNHPVSSRGN
jgi:hypothetical protein